MPDGLLGAILDAAYPLALLCGLACVASVAVRFWGSRGAQRAQIKWFAYAIAVTLGVQLLGSYLLDGAIAGLLMLLASPLVATAVGIAVLRYRLYDVDLLINRTLVYGALSAILALVYFGGVATLQAILQTLAGQEQLPQFTIVVSTLVIAALFSPLRQRIQGLIDRRFYRRKYDAARTLAAFNARLRDETRLDALSEDLLGVVTRTVQPAHASLWLRPEAGPKGDQVE